MTIEDVKQAKSYVKNMQVKDEILRYIICLCEKTREHEHVELGISPRGVGALAEMAKSFALCEGRTYVVPDDCDFSGCMCTPFNFKYKGTQGKCNSI